MPMPDHVGAHGGHLVAVQEDRVVVGDPSGMPSKPSQNMPKNVTWMPMATNQKATLPMRSFSMRPVTFGNQ